MTSWTPLVEHHDGMLKRNRNLDSKIVALGDGMEMKLIMQALNRGILLRGGEGLWGEIPWADCLTDTEQILVNYFLINEK